MIMLNIRITARSSEMSLSEVTIYINNSLINDGDLMVVSSFANSKDTVRWQWL